ncbi:MAG: VWA domain-containing protein [Alistipes sp.]|nr:VWA domain-containing protein [Alistipes sp.]
MYSQDITRKHRAAIVLLIDQSWSMAEISDVDCNIMSKAEMVSIVAGRLIDELLLRSFKNGKHRNYFDIAILGYSNDKVYSLISDNIGFCPITSLTGVRVPKHEVISSFNGQHGERTSISESASMWIKPKAEGNTPMMQALLKAEQLIEEWCSQEENHDSFPPLLFNITDGEASDGTEGELRQISGRIKKIGTNDGNTLMVNIHVSTNEHQSVIFPCLHEIDLSCKDIATLAYMSSEIPQQLNNYVRRCRTDYAQPPYLAMGYNNSIVELVALLNIGTRSVDISY